MLPNKEASVQTHIPAKNCSLFPVPCSLLLFLLLLLSACEGTQYKLKLIEGNFFFARGLYNEAIGSYLEAAQDANAAPYASYALGSAYLALEQNDAALDRFLQAEADLQASGSPDDKNLLHNIHYNMGVVYFKKGVFENAADEFKKALLVKNSSLEAKRNLELSLLSIYMKSNSSGVQEKGLGTVAEEEDKARSEIIFDFVRQKEIERWKSWEWAGQDDDDGPDY